MELVPSTSKNDNQICKLCNKNPRLYVCPKCCVEYCSIECYKSTAHLECSEAFYKECVEEELKTQQCDPQMKQKILEMLKRMYDNDTNDDILQNILDDEDEIEEFDDEELDSDDENVLSLEKRLENIDLDNADQLWSALTTSEKQEFEALIKSGEATKLLPVWDPWWSHSTKKKLVEDLSEQSQDLSYKSKCPPILCVPALESVSRASPFIKFSIINTVYAYAYSALYFNGEHQSSPLDAVYVFLRTCDSMRINRMYKDKLSATESVLLEITNCEMLPGDQETILGTKKAGDTILNCPDENNKSFYILAALSDLHKLMSNAKKKISTNKSKTNSCEFKSKFQSKIDLGSTEVSRKSISLLLKKIEFYIAWLKSQIQTYNITDDGKV